MTFTKRQIADFQSKIFVWWKTNKRDLPWRHTRDPYAIAVSEMMLQQTQVSRVIAKYSEFIEKYPTVFDLAGASRGDVLRIWKGMGYNRRALYLHKMAKNIVKLYGGNFPKDEQLLVKLPGLGKYTARAVLVFAFRENTACVDINIQKIITHFFFHDREQRPAIIQTVADQLVPKGKSWEWHQALMDYGAANGKELRIKKKEVRKKIIPFKETDRFIRGKIIDSLRVKSYQKPEFIRITAEQCEKPLDRIEKIIADLQSDELIEIHKSTVSLPK